MTCPNCGATVAENRRFCGKCGAAMTTGDPGVPPPQPAGPAPEPPSAGWPPPPPLPAPPPSSWGPPAAAPLPPPPTEGPPAAAAPDPFAPPNLDAPNPYATPAYPQGGYPPPGYAAPPPYPQAGYPQAGYPAGYGPGAQGGAPGYAYAPPQNNGLAIASLVLGLIGWTLCGIGSVLAVVLGFVARDQIRRSWGRQTGGGMAVAGIVLGFVGASFWLLIIIVSLVSGTSSGG